MLRMKNLKNRFWNRKQYIWEAALMALLPLLCCVVTCALNGYSIQDVYLPASEWNDELFYFKQVEGIVNFGYPQGYFGFNESIARELSFAAWSPILVWPWILWGLLFGWTLLSPIYCNIFLMMLSIFIFCILVRPSWKQKGMLALLFCCFTKITRFMLSGMPECICFMMVIVTYSIGINYMRRQKRYKLVILFLLTAVMTLMRPYLILFMLLPIYLWVKEKKWRGVCGFVLIVAITGSVYLAINYFLGAEYFTPLFKTDWLTVFAERGIGAGINNLFFILYHTGIQFIAMAKEGFRTGLNAGAVFDGFLVVTVILFYQGISYFRKKNKNEAVIDLYLAICNIGILVAVLLMYKLNEGSRHLLTFMVVDIFAIAMMETKFYKKTILTAAVFSILYMVKGTDSYEYAIPYAEEETVELVEAWSRIFEENLRLVDEEIPNFDNVVIWVFNDTVGEESQLTAWQYLYGLPKGFGVSCCYNNYVIDNYGKLESKYLAVVSEGEVDKLCQQNGAILIGKTEELVLYELR